MRMFCAMLLFTVAAFLLPHTLWAQCPPLVFRVGGGSGGGLVTLYWDEQFPPKCAGDCNGDGKLSVDEIVLSVNMAMGTVPACGCGFIAPLTISDITTEIASSLVGECHW